MVPDITPHPRVEFATARNGTTTVTFFNHAHGAEPLVATGTTISQALFVLGHLVWAAEEVDRLEAVAEAAARQLTAAQVGVR